MVPPILTVVPSKSMATAMVTFSDVVAIFCKLGNLLGTALKSRRDFAQKNNPPIPTHKEKVFIINFAMGNLFLNYPVRATINKVATHALVKKPNTYLIFC